MRFEVRDLAVTLLPRNQGEDRPPGCHGCTATIEECTPTVAPCQCLLETEGCNSEASLDQAPAGKQSREAYQASLGLLRQQLRQHLSQPGAC